MVAHNNGTLVAIGINDTVYFEDVPVYTGHTEIIQSTDVESICITQPYRTIAILVDDTVTVHFDVNCYFFPGSIRVSVTTSGSSPDDSYYIVIDGTDSTLIYTGIPLPNTVEAVLDHILPGPHQVALADVAGNCSVSSGNNPQTVEVVSNETTDVTGPADLNMGNFCWSPDGTKIAGFAQKLDSLDFQAKLYTLDLSSNTVAEVSITDFHLFSGYYAIDWSPDGSKFIFHASGPGGSAWIDIYEVSENGGIATVLAADPTGGNGFLNPKYSPNGSMICMQKGFGAGIWIMSNDGSGLTKIIPGTAGGINPD